MSFFGRVRGELEKQEDRETAAKKKKKKTGHERHTAAGRETLEDVTLEKQAPLCCHDNAAHWVTVLPWHVSPQ